MSWRDLALQLRQKIICSYQFPSVVLFFFLFFSPLLFLSLPKAFPESMNRKNLRTPYSMLSRYY